MGPRYFFIDLAAVFAILLGLLQAGIERAPAERARLTMDDPPAVVEAMRADLAGRLSVATDEVEMVSYAEVDWPDACTGVSEPGRVCAQAVQPGFLARFAVGAKIYRYHGTGEEFIAVSFAPNVIVGEPIRGVSVDRQAIVPVTP